MTVRRRFSIDINILVYAVDLDSYDRHEQSKSILARSALCDCVLPVQPLAEFSHAMTGKQVLSIAQARNFVENWMDVFQMVSADSVALLNAMNAVKSHGFHFEKRCFGRQCSDQEAGQF